MFKNQFRSLNLFKSFNNIPKEISNFKLINSQKCFFSKVFDINMPLFKIISTRFYENKFPTNALVKTPYQCFARSIKSKRKLRAPNTRYKIKNHRGLLKRLIVVGPRWDRQFKFKPIGRVHKSLNKSRANIWRKKQLRLISKADLRRVKRMIPYYKRQRYKH